MKIKDLLESVAQLKSDFEPTKVYKNPSTSQLINIYNNSKHKYLRGFIYNNDVYFWDAYYETHNEMAKEMGIKPSDIEGYEISVSPERIYNPKPNAGDYDYNKKQPVISWHNIVDDPTLPDKPPLNRYLKDGRIKKDKLD